MLRRYLHLPWPGAVLATRTLRRCAASSSKQVIYSSPRPSCMEKVLKETSFHECLMKRIESKTKEIAFVCGETEREVSFDDFKQQCDAFACELYHIYSVRRGNVILVSSSNLPEYGSVVHSILRLGAIISPVNPLSTPDMLANQAERSQATVIATTHDFARQAEAAVQLVKASTGVEVRVWVFDRPLRAEEQVPESYKATSKTGMDDTIMLPFSSGTTGRSKGVQLTNRNVIANMFQVAEYMPTSESIINLEVLPFFHIYGLNVMLNAMLFIAAKQVTMAKFDLVRFLQLIEKYKVTMMNLAPPILIAMMRHKAVVDKFDLSSVTEVFCAAAPLSGDVQRKAEVLFPMGHIIQGYGMTEASPTAVVSFPKCYGNVGMPLSDTEMRIVKVSAEQQSGDDASSGVDVEPGEDGEVWLRGPQIMKGYLDPSDNTNVMVGDWYRTGDIGHVDKDGYLFITDRLKELIKYKGFQVPPAELEGIILTHPMVADAVVVGVPDADDVSFELPRALIVLKEDVTEAQMGTAEKDIEGFVANRVLPYKRLSGGIRFVDVVPKNAAGKLLRRQVRVDEIGFLKKNPLRSKVH